MSAMLGVCLERSPGMKPWNGAVQRPFLMTVLNSALSMLKACHQHSRASALAHRRSDVMLAVMAGMIGIVAGSMHLCKCTGTYRLNPGTCVTAAGTMVQIRQFYAMKYRCMRGLVQVCT